MISDVELDRLLTAWVAEGGERAPQHDVEAALARVASTPQRHRRPWQRQVVLREPTPRWLLVAAALLILLVGVAIGVGAGAIRSLWSAQLTPPSAPAVTAPPPPAPAPAVALRPFTAEDWAASVQIPDGWAAVGEEISEYRHFTGSDPEGHLSVTNENPYGTTICSPDCVEFQVPMTIPYDATAQLEGLKASVGEIVGSDAWTDLPPDVLPELVGGARVDTTAIAADGRPWRRSHVVGLKARNVVAIAWSQPEDVFDEALADAVIGGVELGEAPVYSDGDLVRTTGDVATMLIPGLWFGEDQPAIDGEPVSGVRRFADGRVVVSVGDEDGTLGLCDPDCRQLSGVTSLDELEAGIREGAELGPASATTLGGEPARSMDIDDPVARRYVVAMRGARPVAVLLDAGEWDVAPDVFDSMIESFAFIGVVLEPVADVFTTADGHVELGLPTPWRQFSGDDDVFLAGDRRMTVRVGDENGTITTCDEPAGPWDQCREVTATTLDALADAVKPGPLDDHGIGPPTGLRDATTLDGEPAYLTRIQAYEYQAQGGQELVYIVAIHDGRPYIVRIHTTENELQGVEQVIAGFKFVD